ncbi:MAG: tRNA (N6-isopentenyl adenosine(37)-C2)-methylthiotransferase MiaB, partial [Lachnospiraceae bacterium]|nr:tRNA (N6-isopentenyl adenosine(37)-C2)-methylthiotransferase MiaB [Lachnospiraceae bacterium]
VGFTVSEDENSDLVIYNTCTVRDNANQKVYGRLGLLGSFKKKNPNMKIALCGCMMQEKAVIEKIKKSYSFVDLIFGTHNIFKFPEFLYRMYTEEETVIDIWEDTGTIVESLPVKRKYSYKSGINIMFGCNNFCTYCIVPYVRGRERSRRPIEIIREIEKLVCDGVVEVMLLGQNVNSYGKGLEEKTDFASLLKEVAKIEGLERIRFMTPHPKDLSDDLIEVMKTTPKICRHIHLPLQSGSSRVLKRMNRHYTKEQYLELAAKIRRELPDVAITTDIIVGFPGETREDVLDTVDVIEKVNFDNAFTFIYSKRSNTPAAEYEDQVPENEVKENFNLVLTAVQENAKKRALLYQDMETDVLVEEINENDPNLVTGRMSCNMLVHFEGDESLIGKIVKVKCDKCNGFYYFGHRV